jgi:hypothetical protein
VDLRTDGQSGKGGQARGEGQAADGREEAANAVAWRRARLRKAGFGTALTEQLSREPAVDLHALIGLVERGCPPPLAARILAPLGDERREC